jgi:hypothetical protein
MRVHAVGCVACGWWDLELKSLGISHRRSPIQTGTFGTG